MSRPPSLTQDQRAAAAAAAVEHLTARLRPRRGVTINHRYSDE
ncbi:MAG: hypothetical protein ABEJ05_11710 [Haloglomus sp.]